jgi:hypothetical protein
MTPMPYIDEPIEDDDVAYERIRRKEIDDRHDLRQRINEALYQVINHNSFSRDKLIQLLKEVSDLI